MLGRAALALLLLLTTSEPPPAIAQHIGDVSLTTTTQLLANNVACTGNPQNFPVANLGQSFHLATAAIVSGAASFGMEIDGVDAVGNVFNISNPLITVGTTQFVSQGTGFLPVVRVSVTCTLGSNFSLSYSGSFAANPITNVNAGGTGAIASSTTGGNVQGIVATGVNGGPIFPVIGGGVQPATNAGTLSLGVDTVGFSQPPTPLVQPGTFTFTPPPASKAGEWSLAAVANTSLSASGSTLLGPWACVDTVSPSCSVNINPAFAAIALGTNKNLTFSYSGVLGSPTPSEMAQFINFSNIPSVRQVTQGSNTTVTTGSATLAGSTLVLAITCSTPTCVIAPTDSQGNTWKQIGTPLTSLTATATQGMTVWIVGPTSAAAETITFNAGATSTIQGNGSHVIELTGTTPANANTPSAPLVISNNKFSTTETDPGGVFTETAGYNNSGTLTLTGAATFTFPMWSQSQHGLFNSCSVELRITAASGTTPTLNTFLQDSPDNLGFNDRLSLPQGTVAASFLGATPQFTAAALTAVASSAVTGTDGVLAAGSGIAGPMSAFGRLKFVVGGTTPSFTFNYNVACR